MRTKVISLLYFLTGLLFIILQNQSSFFISLLFKALIIPILIIILVVNIKHEAVVMNRLFFAGLFFSWAGDIVLEFSHINNSYFIPGLICFLTAHIMYFTVFIITPGKNTIFRNNIYLLIPVITYGVLLICFLYDDLMDMRIPVIIYSVVILSMLSGAINRIGKVGRSSFYMVLIGAILFVISDSLIAINKFSCHFRLAEILVMSTYISAQYLIVRGYLKQIS